jgi:hypothetical protein
VIPTPGPGRHVIEVDVPERRVFEEARDVARTALLEHPEAGWIILEQLASVGTPWESWRLRGLLRPAMVGAFDDIAWSLHVTSSAAYRLRIDGADEAYSISIEPSTGK